MKGRDDAADDTTDIVTAKPASVVSGRTIDEIAEAPAHVWFSNRGPDLDTMLASLGVPLTNLDKVLFPEQGITKGQLVAYYAIAAERMLPHVARRPLMLLRCPDGRARPCFFQKHPRETEIELAIADVTGLLELAQLGALEVHTWGSRTGDVEHPDVFVLDLDPDEALPWDHVALAALELRGLLREHGLDSFVKTTGGKGLHVVVPIEPQLAWPELKAYTKALADELEHRKPKAYTTKLAKAHRHGRIFIDYLRNGRGATFVAPYSTRARLGCPIATPITWDELAAGTRSFTLHTITDRFALPDPWADYAATKQRISSVPDRSRARRSR
jgi:bifunctional non-homologous end joining protein LigD